MPIAPTKMGVTKFTEVQIEPDKQPNNHVKFTFNTTNTRIASCKIITVFASRKSNDLSSTLYKQQPVANFSIMNTRKPGS